ncbi:YebC/PmpR family DNA-binding transcriptional regulator [cf. Phormidesmis sp. LEGE 11477]|uniref:YebC/PmpR family DNA-binding transcriptional regulator n=1 Tax=cf. Phormidesmis sp. LEGE 11477 TaxID=1828680 RepID=UPI001880DA93|nr:YebC/PmpR family DNA-binding transcriptional regulator [cf. Phormidesmis sp. LEGE 11477]MBE9062811.1 YebC/PmpR family DNA-binding transcriptional regulator [cf. Phormidesmis sp. LEGE 11477]
MAGHSKWANIKRQKARVDAVKGKVFAKLSREIIVAARLGGGDPDGNFQLRTAIDKAKAASFPKENIDRAIAKGCGTSDGADAFESVRYEGYGPGGVAVLIEALTDNRNRAAADLRSAFGKNGGNLGETGCVGWMFNQKGVVTLLGEIEEEALLEDALEAAAQSYEMVEDVEAGQPGVEVFCEVADLEAVSSALKEKDYTVHEVDMRWIPSNTVQIEEPDVALSLIKMMDALEESDDVQSVTANFDMSEAVMAEVMQ